MQCPHCGIHIKRSLVAASLASGYRKDTSKVAAANRKRRKLTNLQVTEIRSRRKKNSAKELAEEFGVSRRLIYAIWQRSRRDF